MYLAIASSLDTRTAKEGNHLENINNQTKRRCKLMVPTKNWLSPLVLYYSQTSKASIDTLRTTYSSLCKDVRFSNSHTMTVLSNTRTILIHNEKNVRENGEFSKLQVRRRATRSRACFANWRQIRLQTNSATSRKEIKVQQ